MTNTRAVLSTVQLAMLTGNKLRLNGFNNVSGYCQLANVINLNAP
jgi:hypothetical protein